MAGLSASLRALHHGLQSLQPVEQAGYLACRLRGLDRPQWGVGHCRHRRHPCEGPPVGGRRKRGAFAQAIGISRGGRTSKLHALTDSQGRPRVLLLSPGNINDMTMAAELIHAAGPFKRLIADRGYDTNAIRELIAQRGAEAVIPATASRRAPLPYDRHAYRLRNLIERLWCRLKDWRRIATRYDKLAANYLSSALIAAAITYWCN